MWTREDEEAFEELLNTPPPPTPPVRKSGASDEGWRPRLNPTQQLIFDDTSSFILGFGEKGSGKSIGFLHKIVRHAYENSNALILIIAPSIHTGSEGVWSDLSTLVLPAWRDGNVHPVTGEQLDDGMGLEYTAAKLDPNTKHGIIWIGTHDGGWAKLILISIPYASQVLARTRGPSPSMVYVEELTDCEGPEYFKFPAAQLGRRRGIKGPQQYCASCNPKGPSHWVYKRFWETAKCEPNNPDGRLNQDGVWRQKEYSVYHVRIQENLHNLPDGYLNQLTKVFADDPIQMSRLMDGIWVDMPTGRALFKGYFSLALHVVGDAKNSIGLVPVRNAEFPILVGYDPGPVNFSLHLQQLVTVNHKPIWLWFDELNYVGKYKPYPIVVAELINRMWYWVKKSETTFQFEHIADEAAFNHANPSGSFDAADIEKLAREYLQEHPEIKIKPFRLKPCPKGDDSVPARSRMLISMLQSESIRISALCLKTIDMFNSLECEDEKPGKYDPLVSFRPKRSVHLHPFDSGTYPPFYFKAHNLGSVRTDKVAPRVFVAGKQ
jgi:hypothetical protein